MTTLILSRKLGESIVIGDGITVTPVRRSGQVIWLNIALAAREFSTNV